MKTPQPMERLNAYTLKSNRGGVTWDIEGMAVDFITLIKVAQISREAMLEKLTELYDEVQVEVNFPTEGTA